MKKTGLQHRTVQIVRETAVTKRIEALVEEQRTAHRNDRGPPLTADMLVTIVGEKNALRLMLDYPLSRIPKIRPYLRMRQTRSIIAHHLQNWVPVDIAMRFRVSPARVRALIATYTQKQRQAAESKNPAGVQTLT